MKDQIILYGAGKEAEKFYDSFRTVFDIKYVIDKEKNIFFHKLDIFTLEQIEETDLKKYYVIVAMNFYNYNEVRILLESKGLRVYKDFIPSSILNNNRKLRLNEIKEYANKLYVYETTRWFELCRKKYFNSKELGDKEICGGIILPLKEGHSSTNYLGGVFDENYNFVAGLLRHGEERYAPGNPGYWGFNEGYYVPEEELDYYSETVIFGGVLLNHFGHFLVDSMSRLWYYAKYQNLPQRLVFIQNGWTNFLI